MSIVTGVPAHLASVIQRNFLQKAFLDSLRPRLMFRREAAREMLEGRQMGETITQTRRGLMLPDPTPITPGNDPSVGSYTIEQWTATMARYGKALDTRLPNSAVQIVNLFLEDATALAEQAGWTLDRLVRNTIARTYLGGQTLATTAVTGGTALVVASLAGFRHAPVSGKLEPVSGTNPLAITVAGVAANVVAATPTDAAWPDGPGTLTLGANATWIARDRVISTLGPYISRPSGILDVDGLDGTKLITPAQLLEAREVLVTNRVPRFADGTYHVHLDPAHLRQLLTHADFKQLFQGQPGTQEAREGILVRQWGLTFSECTDMPSDVNVSIALTNLGGGSAKQSKELGAEVVNQTGKKIKRSLMLGQAAIREFYVPENQFMAESQGRVGPYGYLGRFLEGTGGFEADLDGLRYIVRPPQDRFMDVVGQAWSFSGDWVCPSDMTATTTTAIHKRAVFLESDG